MNENKIFNEEALKAAIIEQWGPAGAHVEVFDKILSAAKKGQELTKTIEQRISELIRIDGEFCNERWDMSKHELQRRMAREMSNNVTFGRQELQRVLNQNPDNTHLPADPKIQAYQEIKALLEQPHILARSTEAWHIVKDRINDLIEVRINYHINANDPSDFETAYRELYSHAGTVPNALISRLERNIVQIEQRKNGNTDIHWRVWNSVKDLPAMQQLLSK